MAELPKGLIPVDEFAKEKNISPGKVIEKIREAKYVGRKVGDNWYIDPAQSAEQNSNGSEKINRKANAIKLFGLLLFVIGLVIDGFILLITALIVQSGGFEARYILLVVALLLFTGGAFIYAGIMYMSGKW